MFSSVPHPGALSYECSYSVSTITSPSGSPLNSLNFGHMVQSSPSLLREMLGILVFLLIVWHWVGGKDYDEGVMNFFIVFILTFQPPTPPSQSLSTGLWISNKRNLSMLLNQHVCESKEGPGFPFLSLADSDTVTLRKTKPSKTDLTTNEKLE